MIEITGKYTTAKIHTDEVEEECIAQITRMVNHPSFTEPIAIQPDTHAGKGSVIGFTMPLGESLAPNIVGVDIGCGVVAVEVGDSLDHISSELLDHKIRKAVPFGFEVHESKKKRLQRLDYHRINVLQSRIAAKYGIESPNTDYRDMMKVCKRVGADFSRTQKSLGTLGGGNHFCEFCRNQKDNKYWMIIHTGSRQFGLKVCNYWQNIAIKRIKKARTVDLQDRIKEIKNQFSSSEWKKQIELAKEDLGINIKVKSSGLEALSGEDLAGYLFDMAIAQEYARVNRELIAEAILEILDFNPTRKIETIHNYINFDDMIIRKGAVSAHMGEEFVLPLNMRDGTLICVGLGTKSWNYSAPHGAGRTMSRSKAKKELSVDEFKEQMSGIFSTSVGKSTLDEAPGAYKPQEAILNYLGGTAVPMDKLEVVHNMKAS